MAVEVLWSDQAKKTYAGNIAYLEEHWTGTEISKFILRAQYVVLNIENNPELYSYSGKKKKIRKAVINKRVTLYYSFRKSKGQVILLSFWNNYMDDKKRKF